MAYCTRCHTAHSKLNVEAIDGIYKIYAWNCSNCGFETKMAMACVDPIGQRSFFHSMMEPSAPRRAAA